MDIKGLALYGTILLYKSSSIVITFYKYGGTYRDRLF